mgnify:FL=1
MTPRALVLAYGNPLRSDDGVAWHVARHLQKRLAADDVEVMCVHQLTPELAERIAKVERVIFVDAAGEGEPGQIECVEADAGTADGNFTHVLTPQQVLAFAAALYGMRPQAFIVSIAGENFDHGEALSTTVRDALPQLVKRVSSLIVS